MIEGTTKSGIKFGIPKERFADMNFIDLSVEMQNMEDDADVVLIYSKMTSLLFRGKEKKELYKALEDEHGNVPIERVAEVIDSIFEAIAADDSTKNC